MAQALIGAVRTAMQTKAAWVLFSHGTFVVIDTPQNDTTLENQALEAIDKYGEVMSGCAAGDFNIAPQDNGNYFVTGHCPYMYTVVLKDEATEQGLQGDMHVGLYGRSKRDTDYKDQTIIHTEPAKA